MALGFWGQIPAAVRGRKLKPCLRETECASVWGGPKRAQQDTRMSIWRKKAQPMSSFLRNRAFITCKIQSLHSNPYKDDHGNKENYNPVLVRTSRSFSSPVIGASNWILKPISFPTIEHNSF